MKMEKKRNRKEEKKRSVVVFLFLFFLVIFSKIKERIMEKVYGLESQPDKTTKYYQGSRWRIKKNQKNALPDIFFFLFI